MDKNCPGCDIDADIDVELDPPIVSLHLGNTTVDLTADEAREARDVLNDVLSQLEGTES